jgi:hypothetical protein
MQLIRILLLCVAGYLVILIGCALFQRKLLYLPSHDKESNGLSEWRHEGQLIGYARHVTSPETIWLFLHGNGGQASDRTYVLPSFSGKDSVYILEYPGYGSRSGSPSLLTFNSAARYAYQLLKVQFPDTPVCVAAESIGSGPASFLATIPNPPEKIVLITPFDMLSKVAAGHYPFLPVKLILRDNWDNIKLLKDYKGQLEIFGARVDTIIPIARAKALASSKPSAIFHTIEEGHNDWPVGNKVNIRYLRQVTNSTFAPI